MLTSEELPTEHKSVEQWLNEVIYDDDAEKYVPSQFALEFVNFIKLVEGGDPENKTPVVHFKMIDNFDTEDKADAINMCHRGIAKTTLMEYLILYIAIFNKLPHLGEVPYILYVSDSIENGIKKMRKSLQLRYDNSDFLQEYIPDIRFTDVRWEFINKVGKRLVVTGHGAQTGVRGTRENNSRPVLALLDDLISDDDARSPTVISAVEDTVYNAVNFALHPKRRKIIWSGTPFNSKDPLYKAVESGAWKVNVYPVCEEFPCKKEDFKGSWPDRFQYEYVKEQYDKLLLLGKIDSFNQELMLRIMSDEDRLIPSANIKWYKRADLLKNRSAFNFYITTDFTTSDKEGADYCVISVWAINNAGSWFWVDGIVKKQGMGQTIDDLFKYAQMYAPQEVGIEVSGQQGGFIPWIQDEMMRRNIFFNLASDKSSGEPGIRPTTNKFQRFNVVVPWFSLNLMHFPTELRNGFAMKEAMNELELAARKGFKSKHDDFIDSISMLANLRVFKPSQQTSMTKNSDDIFGFDDENDDISPMDSYMV